MNNATRVAIYQRDRTVLTSAQRRRVNRQAHREEHQVVGRASRLRKTMERQERRRLRVEAEQFIGAIRAGWLRPSVRAQLSRARALEALQEAAKS